MFQFLIINAEKAPSHKYMVQSDRFMFKATFEISLAMVAHAFNTSTREAEVGRSLLVRDQLSLQELVPGQLGFLHRETLSRKAKNEKQKKKLLAVLF